MKNLRKTLSAFALVFMAVLSLALIPSDKADAAVKKNHSYTGVDYLLTSGKTKQLSNYGIVKWTSDNTKVASVDQSGKVKAKSGGVAIIYGTTSSGYTYEYEVGVKSKNYYPNIQGKYKVGKDIPAGQYVVIRDTRSNNGSDFAYLAIYKSKKGGLLRNDGFSYTSIVTLKKGQYFDLNGSYAVPFKRVSKSMFSLSKLNKYMGHYGVRARVGYGFSGGTYKFTLKKGAPYGDVYVASKDLGANPNSKYLSRNYLSKSRKSITLKLKKGQYIELSNCTVRKVK